MGNWDLTRDGLDAVWQVNYLEEGNPTVAVPITDPWPNDERELTAAYLDSVGINWYEEDGVFYAWVAQADGLDNDGNSDDYTDLNGNGIPDPGEPGVNSDGVVYADGIDNNGNGIIDEPGEQIIMSKFVYYNNNSTVTGNPSTGMTESTMTATGKLTSPMKRELSFRTAAVNTAAISSAITFLMMRGICCSIQTRMDALAV